MYEVVYFLGAGFSKPMGIPIIGEFIDMSKEMSESKPENYGYFNDLFEKIRTNLSSVKNLFNSNLENIEEVLSLIESTNLYDPNLKLEYTKYIRDVIEYHTPVIGPFKAKELEITLNILNSGSIIESYVHFVLNILNLTIEEHDLDGHNTPFLEYRNSPDVNYSVITLNYDLILENLCRALTEKFYYSNDVLIEFNLKDKANQIRNKLIKLHGCISNDDIVSPTFHKFSDTNAIIKQNWETAYKLLNKAKYIRILGYSLPESDSYVRYLIKTACLNSSTIRGIDVICLDNDGSVKDRYTSFLNFESRNCKFISGNLSNYLSNIMHSSDHIKSTKYKSRYIEFNHLEKVHQEFMANSS